MSAELARSKFVRPLSSVVRVAIISDPIGQISFKFQLLLPLGHTPRVVLELLKNKRAFSNFSGFFVLFSLTWDPMWAKTSKRYSSLKSLLNIFTLFLKLLLSGPHKSTVFGFWVYEFARFFFPFSLTWDPMGAKTYGNKTLLLPQITFDFFFSNFSWIFFSVVPTKVLFLIF